MFIRDRAYAAGDNVTVAGMAAKDELGAWVVSELRADTNFEDGDFGGRVVDVDTEAGTFTLTNGRTYTVPEGLVFEEGSTLLSMDAMAGALDAGDVVTVEGTATKNGETGASEVLTLLAKTNAGPGEFEGRVATLDAEGRTFTLANGRTYTVPEGLELDPGGTLLTWEAMAGAYAAGDNVTVAGMAAKDELGAWVVSELRADTNAEPGEFGGMVTAIDTEAGTFTLKSGRTYTVPLDLVFEEGSTLLTLADMAEALDAGSKVKVSGIAAPDPNTGARLVSTLKAGTVGG